MVELQPSGDEKPVSVTVNRGVLYVLHSGEATDDLFDSEGVAIPNCTTGTPSITGFTVTAAGEPTRIAGSSFPPNQGQQRYCRSRSTIPALPIAMLACARLGAAHTVVFGGFSAEALSGRIRGLARVLRDRLALPCGAPRTSAMRDHAWIRSILA